MLPRVSRWVFHGTQANCTQELFDWLVELVFADRGVRQQKVVCCDACQQRLIDRQGSIAFVKEVLGE
jgi:hypothetical protein